jgi:hypothetical protein
MHRVDFVVHGHSRELERVVFVGLAFNLSPLPCFAARMSDQHLNAKFTSQIHDPTGEPTGFENQQRRFDGKQKLFERFRIGHDGFEYRNRRVILGQQTGHGLEFSKIQSENCFHGRESPGSKELKRVYLNILPNSAFGCPTHDVHGFSYVRNATLGFMADGWTIRTTSVQKGWNSTIRILKKGFIRLCELVDIAGDVSVQIGGVLINALAGVETAWVETIDYLADTWSVFVAHVKSMWNSTVGFLRKAWIKLKSLFDDDVNVEVEMAKIDKEIRTADEAE